jgi:hypothetical protein
MWVASGHIYGSRARRISERCRPACCSPFVVTHVYDYSLRTDEIREGSTTDHPRPGGELAGSSSDNSHLNTRPPPLQLPHVRSGVSDQTNGS